MQIELDRTDPACPGAARAGHHPGSSHVGGHAPRSRAGRHAARGGARTRTAIAATLAVVLVLLVSAIALAASPKRLNNPLTDDVGALGSDRATAQAAMDKLLADQDVQLWVWFTDTFSGTPASDFAVSTFNRNSFGGNDLLLTIAMSDREYGFAKHDSLPLSNATIESLLSSTLERGLRAGNPAQGVADFATAINQELASGSVVTPGPIVTTVPDGQAGGGTTTGTSGGGGSWVGILLVILVVGVVAIAGWWFVVRSRAGGAGGPAGQAPGGPVDDLAAMEPKELEQLASKSLLDGDDAIRDSEQELGFAQAQYGDQEAAPFQQAIEAAKGDLKAAFQIRQQLDDATPETPQQRRAMQQEIVRACRRAQARLDEQAERFEQYRAIEKKAPEILAALPTQITALQARLPTVSATLTRLQAYADPLWQPVATNLDEAGKRIQAAQLATDEGTKALAANDAATAGRAARLGQDALGQGAGFLDAVERLDREASEAISKVDAMLAEAVADVARAKVGLERRPNADATAALAQADQLVTQAQQELAPPKPNPGAAYRMASQANDIADQQIAVQRTAAEQQARTAARLDASVRAAQTTVTRAADYIAARRGGVGTDARTRITEAQRHLDQAVALGPTDPDSAIREAEASANLANQALSAAQSDYDRWNDPWNGPRGRGGGGGGTDIGTAIIGGIIGGMLSGGGRHGGGFGGFGGGGGRRLRRRLGRWRRRGRWRRLGRRRPLVSEGADHRRVRTRRSA